MTVQTIARRSLFSSSLPGSFRTLRTALASAALAAACVAAQGQAAPDAASTPATQTTQTPAPQAGGAMTANGQGENSRYTRGRKKGDRKSKEKVVQSKDTRKEEKKDQKTVAAAGPVSNKLPDKQLYDKAMTAIQKGRFDVARLDLQTMLNTYPDSQYQMRAKLAVADSWYREGGTAALTQAESEYKDFTVFFPNAPEAAEAQMRIGDIYFKQMDKPDRDYSKALHAEEEYRHMLTDYPDAPKTLITQAKTRLREVQEALATRESSIAAYYATRDNYAAVIARYQTVIDTYPLFSHMDDVLIGLGDAFEAEAQYVRKLNIPEGPKARLEAEYDEQAATAFRKVVLEHAAAAHVEDAKDRLAAMNLPIPEPSKEQLAASQALEDSRRQYQISDRISIFLLHRPDTVTTAGIGDPTMTDPAITTAPAIVNRTKVAFTNAFAPPGAAAASTTGGSTPAPAASVPAAETSVAPSAPAQPLAFKDVGTTDTSSPATSTFSPATGGRGGLKAGSSIGVEVLTNAAPNAGAANAATGTPDPNYGLKTVAPANSTPLPPREAAAPAPESINQVTTATPPAQAPAANGRKSPRPAFDKADESSSRHKKKKGIKKLDPLPQ